PSISATPLSSTPSPFTTLFRSSSRCRAGECGGPDRSRLTRYIGAAGLGRRGPNVMGTFPHGALLRDPRSPDVLDIRVVSADEKQDRKSTRLNSSHVATQYAGFC